MDAGIKGDMNIDWEQRYRQQLAEKESIARQLEELVYLLEIKEEHIELLEKKANAAAELQSLLEEGAIEKQSLQHKADDQQKRSFGVRSLKNELEEELINALQMEKSYLALQQSHFHITNELLVLQAEIKELSELNHGLLKELEKLTELQSRIEIIQAENNNLKQRLL